VPYEKGSKAYCATGRLSRFVMPSPVGATSAGQFLTADGKVASVAARGGSERGSGTEGSNPPPSSGESGANLTLDANCLEGRRSGDTSGWEKLSVFMTRHGDMCHLPSLAEMGEPRRNRGSGVRMGMTGEARSRIPGTGGASNNLTPRAAAVSRAARR
jgi:hypothetical protein